MTDDDDWDDEIPIKPMPLESEPLTRLEYLRLLRLGYIRNMHSSAMPLDLWAELEALEEEERERVERERAALEKLRREEEEAKREAWRAERERNEAPEAALEEHWSNQRQLGKTQAAEAWAKKYGVELPVILEAAETEEEMREAIRKLRNVAQAKQGPRGGTRKGGVERKG